MAKKITASFNTVMNEKFPNEKSIDWNGVGIKVQRTIGISDMMDFVRSVVDSCFDEGMYLPELLDFAFRVNVVKKFTDISLPAGSERQYALLYRTDIYTRVLAEVDGDQFRAICDAVEAKIEYECDIQRRDLKEQVDRMISSLGGVADSAMTLFGGVSSEDIASLVRVIGEGRFEDDRLGEAAVNAILSNKQE